ncbi:hypothetical protein H0A61_00643 [Koleobacter methoxysyntrophicus]|uniref:DUF4338 domain-containing protein n=1 Tax=Koleobacter methoxysyntrophicus TaxID=2751313 RepID=A0A8A0RIP4_9FIRM|nr:DUF4338 domain-containing protein [Koleobacter methoxysyntrophicus]QSQ08321.1 hypothetical protein H0A61_00643 [Koleobacter methoxysyntrophicus]
MRHNENGTVLLYGRMFTDEELQDIIEMVRLFPNLSRHELAQTICECLSWKAPNGRYKIDACRKLLNRLEKEKAIVLPEKRKIKPRAREQIVPGQKTEPEPEIRGTVSEYNIELESVRSKEGIHLWNEYVERYHMLGYKRPFGAHQRYFIWSSSPEKRRLGCILFSAAAWALAKRDAWIGWNKEERSQRLHLIVNNSRFLIFPWVKVKNLASKVLSLAARQVPVDWRERYGFEPVLLETFVDVELYQGTCYQAANWVCLGQTTGRGRMDRFNQHLSSPKWIYMYPLRHDFRAILCGESSHPAYDRRKAESVRPTFTGAFKEIGKNT